MWCGRCRSGICYGLFGFCYHSGLIAHTTLWYIQWSFWFRWFLGVLWCSGQIYVFGGFSAGWVGLVCYTVKYNSRGGSLVVLQHNSIKVFYLWCLPCIKFSLLCVLYHCTCLVTACFLVTLSLLAMCWAYLQTKWRLVPKKPIPVSYRKGLTKLTAVAVWYKLQRVAVSITGCSELSWV